MAYSHSKRLGPGLRTNSFRASLHFHRVPQARPAIQSDQHRVYAESILVFQCSLICQDLRHYPLRENGKYALNPTQAPAPAGKLRPVLQLPSERNFSPIGTHPVHVITPSVLKCCFEPDRCGLYPCRDKDSGESPVILDSAYRIFT